MDTTVPQAASCLLNALTEHDRPARRRKPSLAGPTVAAVVLKLLRWFSANARELPWRKTTSAYAIWISEVMLQQTQVRTVIPYWERWMKQLPDVVALAQCDFVRVLKLWEGLGYYTRARHLHRASQVIVAEHGGVFPDRYEAVLGLPGIGRYTAGAICSIAFNQPTPILDGNVTRVLTRVFGIGGNPRSPRVNERLWKKASAMVEWAANGPFERGCAHLNQALMELGALVCTPRQPKCTECPVRNHCVAFATDRVDRFPALPGRAKPTARQFTAFVVSAEGRFLMSQRPGGGVNAHLWEFPNIEHTDRVIDLTDRALGCLGWRPRAVRRLCRFQHSITRYRIQLEAYTIPAADNGERAGDWLTLDEIDRLALPSAHRKILAAVKSDLCSIAQVGPPPPDSPD